MIPALAAGVPVVVYLLAAHRFSRRMPRRWSRWRTAAFVAGALTMGLALSPGVDAFAHDDARGHMAQHLMLGMYAPVGLVLGAPVTLLLSSAGPGVARSVAALLRSRPFHAVAHPVTAAVLSVGPLFVLYLTPVYAASTDSLALHHGLHMHFLLAGYLFTWSVAGPDPAPHRPGLPLRVVVLVVAGAAHGLLAKLLYAGAGVLVPGAAAGRDEVRAAAQLMYYGGDVAELLLAVALFAAWYRRRGRVHRHATTARPLRV